MTSPSAIAWLSRRWVTDADAIRPPGSRRLAHRDGGRTRVPARGGVDRQVDPGASARRAVRDGVEPRVRAALHAARSSTRCTLGELGVHAHRADALLVRGLPRDVCAPRAVL